MLYIARNQFFLFAHFFNVGNYAKVADVLHNLQRYANSGKTRNFAHGTRGRRTYSRGFLTTLTTRETR